MDQVQIGLFLAQLRKERGLTQQALGEKLGVTNKTVSRWENGNYMPDIDMLLRLSAEYGVSLNELLSGRRLPDPAFRQEAEANLEAVCRQNPFSLEERCAYWKSKWRREHRAAMIVNLLLAAACLLTAAFRRPLVSGLLILAALVWNLVQRNRMMAYVEQNAYDGSGQ